MKTYKEFVAEMFGRKKQPDLLDRGPTGPLASKKDRKTPDDSKKVGPKGNEISEDSLDEVRYAGVTMSSKQRRRVAVGGFLNPDENKKHQNPVAVKKSRQQRLNINRDLEAIHGTDLNTRRASPRDALAAQGDRNMISDRLRDKGSYTKKKPIEELTAPTLAQRKARADQKEKEYEKADLDAAIKGTPEAAVQRAKAQRAMNRSRANAQSKRSRDHEARMERRSEEYKKANMSEGKIGNALYGAIAGKEDLEGMRIRMAAKRKSGDRKGASELLSRVRARRERAQGEKQTGSKGYANTYKD